MLKQPDLDHLIDDVITESGMLCKFNRRAL